MSDELHEPPWVGPAPVRGELCAVLRRAGRREHGPAAGRLAFAMADPELRGFWGGTSERERRAMRLRGVVTVHLPASGVPGIASRPRKTRGLQGHHQEDGHRDRDHPEDRDGPNAPCRQEHPRGSLEGTRDGRGPF